jgi:hypothetical protein
VRVDFAIAHGLGPLAQLLDELGECRGVSRVS